MRRSSDQTTRKTARPAPAMAAYRAFMPSGGAAAASSSGRRVAVTREEKSASGIAKVTKPTETAARAATPRSRGPPSARAELEMLVIQTALPVSFW